jgi:hypothetical protein
MAGPSNSAGLQGLKALLFRSLDVASEQAAEEIVNFVVPSEARNLSSVLAHDKKERFLASLGMTKRWGSISAACEAAAHKTHPSDGL